MRKFFTAILIILFFFLFNPVLYAYNVKFIFLRPALYKHLIESGRISKTLSDVTSSILISSIQKQAEGQNVSLPFSAQELSEAINKIFPQEWMNRELGGLADNFFAWFYYDTPELNLVISLKEVKKDFIPAFSELFRKTTQNIPECTPAQASQLARGDRSVLCLPKGVGDSDVQKFSQNQDFADLSAALPDQIDLLNIGGTQSGASNVVLLMAPLNQFRDYAHLAFLILYLVTGGFLFILLLIVLLTWKPFGSILKTLGLTIIIPSGLLLLLSVASYFLSAGIKISQILSLAGVHLEQLGLDPRVLDSIGGIFSDLITYFALYKIIECGIIVVVSIGFIILGVILNKKKTIPNTPNAQPLS